MAVAAILKGGWPLTARSQPETIDGGAADEQAGLGGGFVPGRAAIHGVYQAGFCGPEIRTIHEAAPRRVAALTEWPTRDHAIASIPYITISV